MLQAIHPYFINWVVSRYKYFELGVIGSYAWRAYDNTKQRPLSVILKIDKFNKKK